MVTVPSVSRIVRAWPTVLPRTCVSSTAGSRVAAIWPVAEAENEIWPPFTTAGPTCVWTVLGKSW